MNGDADGGTAMLMAALKPSWLALLAGLWWLPPSAQARGDASANIGASATVMASCVSDAVIAVGGDERSAVLDDADRVAVSAEIARRYPVLDNDGLLPSRIVLWQRRDGDLLYVSLLDNPSRPGEACFTATFAARRFDATLLLRRKYLAD